MSLETVPYETDDDGMYTFHRPVTPDEILEVARNVLESRTCRGACLSSPMDTKQYLAIELGSAEHEVFCCLFFG